MRASPAVPKNAERLGGGSPHPNPLPKGEGRTGFVRLADIAMTWHADGTCCGAAAFDLEPGGAGECPLQLPDGYELLQVSVEGMPVAPQAVGDRSWRFPLASQRLPQRVEVFFRGALGNVAENDRCTFDAPALGQWPVRQTLWTIVGPPSWPAGEPEDRGRRRPLAAGIVAAEECRRRRSSRPPPSRPTTRTKRRDGIRFGPAGSRLPVRRCSANWPRPRPARRLRLPSGRPTPSKSVLPSWPEAKKGDITDITEESVMTPFPRRQPAVRCGVEGWADSLALDYRPAERDWFSHRLGVAGVLAALTCLAIVGLRRGGLTQRAATLAARCRRGFGAGLVAVADAECAGAGHRVGQRPGRGPSADAGNEVKPSPVC